MYKLKVVPVSELPSSLLIYSAIATVFFKFGCLFLRQYECGNFVYFCIVEVCSIERRYIIKRYSRKHNGECPDSDSIFIFFFQ